MRVFLLTSFPSLSFSAPAPLGLDEVISRCANHLPDQDQQELEDLLSAPPGGDTPFAKDWAVTWQLLQHRNHRERSSRLPGTPTPAAPSGLPDPDSQLHHDLDTAWAESDPLKRETALLRAEWNWIDARRRLSPYSFDDLAGFVLQVQLLERKDRWEQDAGHTQFETHVRSFMEPVHEHLQETPA
jgi:hypothetical protein